MRFVFLDTARRREYRRDKRTPSSGCTAVGIKQTAHKALEVVESGTEMSFP